MFDGGGAGVSGNRFEGGGILSELGNTFFRPLGYSERLPMAPVQTPTQNHHTSKPTQVRNKNDIRTNTVVERPQSQLRPKSKPRTPTPIAESSPKVTTVPLSHINPSTAYEPHNGVFQNPAEDFTTYLNTLSDDEIINTTAEEIVEQFSEYQSLYKMYVEGLGTEAESTDPKVLYEGFSNTLRMSTETNN